MTPRTPGARVKRHHRFQTGTRTIHANNFRCQFSPPEMRATATRNDPVMTNAIAIRATANRNDRPFPNFLGATAKGGVSLRLPEPIDLARSPGRPRTG